MVSRRTANINMTSIKCTFVLVVIVALQIDVHTLVRGEIGDRKELSDIDSSNLMVNVSITVLHNAVAKGAGKCGVCQILG